MRVANGLEVTWVLYASLDLLIVPTVIIWIVRVEHATPPTSAVQSVGLYLPV